MGKNHFTEEELNELRANPYIERVTWSTRESTSKM